MGALIGVDTGGTFTDLVRSDGDALTVAKVPSTPSDPGRAVLSGLAQLGGVGPGDHVVHGTTVALNALLTGRTAPAALVTGAGFGDLLEIARQDRPDLYALTPEKPRPLIPRELRFEIQSRLWPDPAGTGFVRVARPTRDQLATLRRRVGASGAASIVIALLHAWAEPELEDELAEALAPLGLPITTSAGLLPVHREFERTSTAAVNAVLVPLMRDYLGSLAAQLAGARLSILQSSGGTLAAEAAALAPVRVLLSGPAGGVLGAAHAAREAGLGDFVAFDMGGTSTDVAFQRAGAHAQDEAARALEPVRVAGHPVGVPTLDIHTVGCGGGSLVTVDAGGVLHVGPGSAGADPGPVCYGKSDRPTVTDAHVFLGHVAEGAFLAGDLTLDQAAVARAFAALGARLGAAPRRAAEAVLEVARAAMRRAIGVMTMQRGIDPRELSLVAYGGAGGLHAAALATSLGMRSALVPALPGALSARGMTRADALRDHTRTVLAPLSAWPSKRLAALWRELDRRGRDELADAGFQARDVTHRHTLGLRYAGQSFELALPDGPDAAARFHRAHEALYGYALADRPIELVSLTSRSRVPEPPPLPRRVRRRELPTALLAKRRRAVFGDELAVPVLDRAELGPGHAFPGPALVEEYSGTTLVPPAFEARVTADGHLLLTPRS